MPHNIHGHPQYATGPATERLASLENQIANLTQQLAHLTGMMQQQMTRPNPAPQQGIGENALLQLLLAEKDRSERMHERLMQANDPAAQIDSLVALSEILPQPEKAEDDSGMLKTAVKALGSVMMAGGSGGMDFDDEDPGGAPPPIGHGSDGPSQQPAPSHPFSVQADSGEGYIPPAFGSVDVGD